MDWGLDNPNKTATLIAILMILTWSLVNIPKWGFWLALSSFVGLGLCLIHTVSRGGMLSMCAGAAVLLLNLSRPWDIRKSVAILVGLSLIVAFSFYLKTYSRYGQGITQNDLSITNRLHIWKSAPRMMVDAPNGWGIGNSGRAYMQWYQPLDSNEQYRTLVNSHLTWLVEFGWPLRFLYLLIWVSVLMICFPRAKGALSAIPFAIWIAFGVGAFFSSIAESIWMWLIPGTCLFVALFSRFLDKSWPPYAGWCIPVALSAASLIILIVLGTGNGDITVRGSRDQVALGSDPKIWVITDTAVLGPDFGRTLRQEMPDYSIGLITSSKIWSGLKGSTLIVCGNVTKEELPSLSLITAHFQKILFVNPGFFPEECKLNVGVKVNILFGEYSRSFTINNWARSYGKRVGRLPGVGDFVPDWPKLLLNPNEDL